MYKRVSSKVGWWLNSQLHRKNSSSCFIYNKIHNNIIDVLSWQIWSVTTGALMDTLCGSLAPVTSVVLYKSFVVSASTAAASIQMWNLKYDTQHKPTAHIPSGCVHVTVTKDADRVFYVRQPSQTEVISWNNHTGQCLSRDTTAFRRVKQERFLLRY